MKLLSALLWATLTIGCAKSPEPSGGTPSGGGSASGGGTSSCCKGVNAIDTSAELSSLATATAAIRDAFARGDIETLVALHSPDIVKYFGGTNVVRGRENFRKGLVSMFRDGRMEFIGNQVESTVFAGNVAIQTSIFTIKHTPSGGGKPSTGRGRAMVVYVKDKSSPTGWLSIREMAQEAP
jgi:ketosteroid isomerase-like protein